jgi:hypothetical protein
VYSFTSQVERHSLAVGLSEAQSAGVSVDIETVASVVLATDLAKHQEFVSRLFKRTSEIADFSRRFDDQVTAFCAMLKAADLCHLYKTPAVAEAAKKQLAAELQSGDSACGLASADLASSAVFVKHVALPLLQTLEDMFPATAFAAEAAKVNFSL